MLAYDTLVLATGARHAYFGHDDWEPSAPGLKTLEDATTIRGRILIAFERAEQEDDETKRAALMTFVIVGAGPTGVELAGTIAELARATLPGGLPQYRYAKDADRPDRGGSARASRLQAGLVGLCAAFARTAWGRGRAGTGGHRMHGRGRRLWRQDPGRGDDHLGGGGAGLARCAMARRAGRPGRAPEGRTGPHRPGPSGDLRDRRRSDRRRVRTDGPFRASRRPPSRKAPMSPK